MLYVPEKAGDRAVRVRSGIIQELAEASACRRSLLKLSRFNDWSVTAVAGEILYRLIAGMRATVDLHSQGSDEVLECKARGRPLVFVNWHGQNSVNIGIYHPIFGSDARGVIMVHDSPRARIMRHLARVANALSGVRSGLIANSKIETVAKLT